MPSQKKALLTIFLVVFIDLLGFGLVIPILPYYAESYGASATTLGWLMMSYSGMQFLFSPFWGRISDRIGRRPVLLTCIFGISLSMLILGFAPSLTWLFVARILAGFFGANLSAATAYIADVTPPEKRAKGMGLIGAAFGMGFLFGPALGGFLSQWGYGTGGKVAAGLAALNFIFAFFFLKEPDKTQAEREANRRPPLGRFWRSVLSKPQTGLAVVLFFLITTAIAQLETSFAFFVLARFQLDALHAGLILALMAFVMALIQGGAIGRLAKKTGERKLITFGTAIMMMALVGSSFSPNLGFFIATIVVHAIGYSVANPSLYSLVSRNAEEGMQGATMGIYQSAGSLGRIVGPLAAGVLFDHLGINVPFLAAAGLFGLCFILVSLKGRVWSSSISQ